MSRKALAMTTQFPEVHETCQEIESMVDHVNERRAFLKKQYEDLAVQLQKDSQPLWEKLEKQLAERGCSGDYNHKNDAIGFSLSEGVIYMEKDAKRNHGSNLPDFIRGLFS